jgi:hypothetical protein
MSSGLAVASGTDRFRRRCCPLKPVEAKEQLVKSFVRIGGKVRRQKKTQIGHSSLTRFTNKHKRRQAKLYRGQGKPLS